MLSVKKQAIFNSALNEAKKSSLLYQHGCVATCGGKIIARGVNNNKCYSSTDIFLKNVCTCHAEIDVLNKIYKSLLKKGNLQKADKMFRKTTLYITRYNEKDETHNSAPCMDCLIMIKQFKIKRMIFYQDNKCFIVKPNDYNTTHRSYGQTYINKLSKQ